MSEHNEGTVRKKEIDVYSEKYDIHGIIRDFGVVTKLYFTYDGKEVVMGIRRDILNDESYEELGRKIIDSYVSNLSADSSKRKLQLHFWYIGRHDVHGTMFLIGHGIVTGHKKLADSIDMHTSAVEAVHIDEDEKALIMVTRNSVYHCPLAYCRFSKQDEYPDIIPDYEYLKAKYQGTVSRPSIEPGKVLLVLANFCEYYFHSMYYVPEDSEDGEPLDYTAYPHVGTYQDSYLVSTEDYRIDLRYFPHYQNIEFYSGNTDGHPLYLENLGDTVIYARTWEGLIKLNPGERKEVKKENAEDDSPTLPDGDLYPTEIIE